MRNPIDNIPRMTLDDVLALREAAKDNPSRPSTPEEARDEIAAMILDASTELAKRKTSRISLKLSSRLADIAERIAALTYR